MTSSSFLLGILAVDKFSSINEVRFLHVPTFSQENISIKEQLICGTMFFSIFLQEKYNRFNSILGKYFPEIVLNAFFIILDKIIFKKMAFNEDYSTMYSQIPAESQVSIYLKKMRRSMSANFSEHLDLNAPEREHKEILHLIVIQILKTHLDVLKLQDDQHIRQLKKLKELIQRKDTIISGLNDQIRTMKQEKRDMNCEMTKKTWELDEARKGLNQYRDAIEMLQKESHQKDLEMRNTILSLERENSIKEQEISKLGKQLRELQSSYRQNVNDLDYEKKLLLAANNRIKTMEEWTSPRESDPSLKTSRMRLDRIQIRPPLKKLKKEKRILTEENGRQASKISQPKPTKMNRR